MKKTRVGILNVTGYVGADLARILSAHPGVTIASVTGRSEAGKTLGAVFPHLAPLDLAIGSELGDVDLVFSALPHAASAEALLPFVNKNIPVIDTSADFRLNDPQIYRQWYDHAHPAPHLLAGAVYGLPELNRERIAAARIVANPGCYPTSSILALAPALKEGLVSGNAIVDAKSGVSGAGRTLKLDSHFSEVNENVAPYALGGHRHWPEIVQEMSKVAGREVLLTFTPHLVPMTRGMLSACYATLARRITSSSIQDMYRCFYRDEPFVKVIDYAPHTKYVLGSNRCLVHPFIDERTGTLVAISCIDNLVKGAAGQAVQNMNIMLRIPEKTGIDTLALYP